MNIYRNYITALIVIAISCFLLTGCGGGKSNIDNVNEVKPNLEWREKVVVINGSAVNYTIQSGNPIQVSLPESSVKQQGITYVTPAIENMIVELMKDSDLLRIINSCGLNKEYPAGLYDGPLNNKRLNLENIIYVDQVTGRKEVDVDVILDLKGWLNSVATVRVDSPSSSCVNSIDSKKIADLISSCDSILNEYQKHVSSDKL